MAGASSEPDPIFAAIDRHRAALRGRLAASRNRRSPTGGGDWGSWILLECFASPIECFASPRPVALKYFRGIWVIGVMLGQPIAVLNGSRHGAVFSFRSALVRPG